MQVEEGDAAVDFEGEIFQNLPPNPHKTALRQTRHILPNPIFRQFPHFRPHHPTFQPPTPRIQKIRKNSPTRPNDPKFVHYCKRKNFGSGRKYDLTRKSVI